MICLGDGYAHFDQFIEALQTITGWDINRDQLLG